MSKKGFSDCFGSNISGESTVPGQLTSGVDFLSAGDSVTCALLSEVFNCWGIYDQIPTRANVMEWIDSSNLAATEEYEVCAYFSLSKEISCSSETTSRTSITQVDL